MHAVGGVGIQHHAEAFPRVADGVYPVGVRGTAGKEPVALRGGGESGVVGKREPLALAEQFGGAGGIAAKEVVDEAFEIRGAGNVHGRAGGFQRVRRTAHAVSAGAEKLVQHIVFVGGHDQAVNRNAHLADNMARTNIAEITGGNGETDFLCIIVSDANPAGNVIDYLRHEACPVNGIHGANAVALFKLGVVTHGLHNVLAIIKHTVQRDIVNIWVIKAKHLGLLEGGHAASGGQHEHGNAGAAAHGVLRCGPRIPRGGTQDVERFAAPGEFVFKKLAEQLHGHVFKRGGGAFGQVPDKEVVVQFGDGHDVRGGKRRCGVGPGADRLDILGGNVAHKELDHLGGQRSVPLRGQGLTPCGERVVADLGIIGGEVEAPVGGQSAEQNVSKRCWGALGVAC